MTKYWQFAGLAKSDKLLKQCKLLEALRIGGLMAEFLSEHLKYNCEESGQSRRVALSCFHVYLLCWLRPAFLFHVYMCEYYQRT